VARGTADLESSVIAQLRKAAVDRLPVDAGLCARAAGIVRAAYARGGEDTALALAQAYQLFLADDDLDALRDALTALLPPDYVAPEPGAEGPARI
jgi:hypothetical protein